MAMIVELTESFVMQEHFEGNKLYGPVQLYRGMRGMVKDAGFASGFPGIEDGTEIVAIQFITELAEFDYAVVPLSILKIVYDRKNMPSERQAVDNTN